MQVCIVHTVPMLVDGRLMAVYTTRSAWNLTDLVGHTHTLAHRYIKPRTL